MATTLQNCSNVILDFWNEAYNPNATLYPTAQSDYFALVNETINTIRGNGINTLLMVQWFYGIGCNIYFPPPAPPTSPPPDFYANVLNWVYDYPLTGSNIVYETHIYNAFGQNVTYSEEQQGLTYCWIPYVTNNMSKPLLIGEIGANVWWTGDNLVAELRTFNYTLQILNSWGIGYTAFFFGINQMYSLITSYNPSWTPSGAGTVLMKNIAVTPPKLP